MFDTATIIAGALILLFTLVCVIGFMDAKCAPGEGVWFFAIWLGVVYLFLLALGMATAVSVAQMRELLGLVITVTGIAGSLVIAFSTREYAYARHEAKRLQEKLKEDQGRLNYFREMCSWSLSSHDFWREMRKTDTDEVPRAVSRLYSAIDQLGGGITHRHSQAPHALNLIEYDALANLKEASNVIWYRTGGDGGATRVVKDFLKIRDNGRCFATVEMFINPEARDELLSREAQNKSSFPTLQHWCQISGDMEALCDKMLRRQKEIENLSVTSSLIDNKNIGLLMSSGILVPLVLIAFRYNMPDAVFLGAGYATLAPFIGAIIRLGKELLEFLNPDFHQRYVVRSGPDFWWTK